MTRSVEGVSDGAVSVRDYLSALNRRKVLILGVALPVFAAAALFSFTRTPTYTAQASVLVKCTLTPIAELSRTCDVSATTEMNVARSQAVASSAAQLMGASGSANQLLRHVSVDMVEGTQVLTISFADRDPVRARQGADAFAAAYLFYRGQQARDAIQQRSDALESQLKDIGAEIGQLLDSIHSLPIGSPDRADDQSRVTLLESKSTAIQTGIVDLQSISVDPGAIIDPPRLPTAPTSPRHARDLAIGLVLGLMIGIGVALIREQGNDELRIAPELERSLGASVLASIPRTRMRNHHGLVVADNPYSPEAAAYRRVRIGLLGLAERSDLKSVLVTSPRMGEGKSATVANLGAGFAEIGKKVVLVSADLRRSSLASYFALDEAPGLMDLLGAETQPSELIRETHLPGLCIVGSGRAGQLVEPVNLLQTDSIRELLAECADRADIVVVDSPPVLGVPDALVLARLVDAVILVADARHTTHGDVLVARDELGRVGGHIVAGVLNGVHVSHRDRDSYVGGNFGGNRVPRDLRRTRPREAHPVAAGPRWDEETQRRGESSAPAPEGREAPTATTVVQHTGSSDDAEEPSKGSASPVDTPGAPSGNGSETGHTPGPGQVSDPQLIEEPRIGFRAASKARRSRSSVLRIDRPAGVRPGDVMIAALLIAGGTRVRAPSGWTEVQNETSRNGEVRLSVCYRSAGSNEPPFYMWPMSGRQSIAGQIVAYSGVGANPIDASGCRRNGSSTELRAPSIETTTPDGFLVGIFGINGNTEILSPDEMSERAHISSGGDGEVTLHVADQPWTRVGASGPRVATAMSPGAYVGALIALRAQ